MKKVFTLIELLAVIVILAIIALIATPIVLNIINEARESSDLRSAEFYLDAVEYAIADAMLYEGGMLDGDYSITKEGNLVYFVPTLRSLCQLQEEQTANVISAKYSCDFGGGARNLYILGLGTAQLLILC